MLEDGLFRTRWLLAPFYVGLAAGLGALLFIFGEELVHQFSNLLTMTPSRAIRSTSDGSTGW